ncbi:hypothetical protein ABRQ21_07030 [Latilactobacillus sakei]|uniref:hypothetical protein n=1 Tax=Latilactobacillus sakei TaxID=1599 RepID=UPI0013014DF7|nr:hypothetical protein [Latilactobacillus sakei]MCP8851498.1 hypothetical protein [Latilactobacillus sakei]
MGFLYIVSIVLLIAKVMGLLAISWLWVFAPAIANVIIQISIVAFAIIVTKKV